MADITSFPIPTVKRSELPTVSSVGDSDSIALLVGGANKEITFANFKKSIQVGTVVQLMLSNMSTALTTGTEKGLWAAPSDGSLFDFWIGVNTVSSSGAVTVNLKKNGTSVLTTKPSIDATEKTSLTGTSAVIGTHSFSKGDLFTFDIDAAGTGAKALMATVVYNPS